MFTIGVGVFVLNKNRILLGRRGPASKSGAGLFALPGGMADEGENIEETATREVYEETGLKITVDQNLSTMHGGILGVSYPSYNHLTFWIQSQYLGGEPEAREPEKCARWDWYSLEQIGDIPGVMSKDHPQYYWIPYSDWLRILPRKNPTISYQQFIDQNVARGSQKDTPKGIFK